MSYDTVLFDLDGTLLDTLGDLTAAVGGALLRFSFKPPSKEQVRARIGDGLRKLMERCLPEGTDEVTVSASMEAFRTCYKERLFSSTSAYPGMGEVINAVRAAGIKTAVATNKDESLARLLISRFFDGDLAVCGMDGEKRRKPAADIPLAALAACGGGGRVLFVGDSKTDRLTARECGFDFAGVAWGYGDCTGGVFKAEKPKELIKFILS